MELDSFRKNKIGSLHKILDDERNSIEMINISNDERILNLTARIKDTTISIRLNDPELMILLNDYYLKQEQISDMALKHLEMNFQDVQSLEDFNKSQHLQALYKIIQLFLIKGIFTFLSACCIILPWLYYSQIVNFFNLSYPVIFWIVQCSLGVIIYNHGRIITSKYKVYLKEFKSYKKYLSDYSVKFQERKKVNNQ
jgi:hypothetical protein